MSLRYAGFEFIFTEVTENATSTVTVNVTVTVTVTVVNYGLTSI